MIVFTRKKEVVDPDSGQTVETLTTIAGEGYIEEGGDPQRYAALNLIPSQAPTIFFTPNGYPRKAFTDDFVKPGDTTPINGIKMVVKDVEPFAPDAFVIYATIVVTGVGAGT